MSKKRFDLTALPLCGATTRAGTPCKRRGSKLNGKCKLHGGQSTGPRTKSGKLKSSRNAAKKMPTWAMCKITDKEQALFNQAYQALQVIKTLGPNIPKHGDTTLNTVVEVNREALEVMKFAILQEFGMQDFILLQAALDHYYQDSGAPHLECHVHYTLFSHPQFNRWRSQRQSDYLDEHLDKAATKEMRKLERNFKKMQLGH
ncbi:hypothetical protein BBM84_10510 [Vibrio parahaemolyticus]|uniref:HGGxSTG domain-containing protein n=1 Tax=Vibrio parahaemolyticus TaxID=670 RepID=UPI00084AFCAB|nr:HGGxSTG domain-containing protein [Vibrio parahaemolyticus]OEB65300.1 hypothetical protein BBM84_10510 [Vibrio parahaemolyticus]